MELITTTVGGVDGLPLLICSQLIEEPGSATITLNGELDCIGNHAVDGALERIWDVWPESVTVDLRRLTFINVGGLRSLLLTHRTAQARGVWLTLQCRPGVVARVVERIGLVQQQELQIPGPVAPPVLAAA